MKEKNNLGDLIYTSGKIEVRANPKDFFVYDIYIGKHSFPFSRGCLDDIAENTPLEDLEIKLQQYNPKISEVLKQEEISPERFALCLARARIKERDSPFVFTEAARQTMLRGLARYNDSSPLDKMGRFEPKQEKVHHYVKFPCSNS